MEFLETTDSNSALVNADSSDLGLTADNSDILLENDSALANPLNTALEPIEASNVIYSDSEVISEPIAVSSLSPRDTAFVNSTADSLTGASATVDNLVDVPLIDGLFTVDELLAKTGFPTRAPDLISVGNFRPGTPTDDGNPRTFVDYTFDEPAELSGGDATNFNLVPVDGGPVLDAKELIDGDNTNVYTIAYLGTIEQTDIARGFVDSGTVRDPNKKPTNPLQSADVSNGGNTSDPDLVSVVPNVDTNELIYTFDQEVNIDDDAGFGFYKRNGKEFDGSLARQLTPTTVAVEFVDVEVSSAVGATVDNGAVADLQDDSNQPDEVLVGTPA